MTTEEQSPSAPEADERTFPSDLLRQALGDPPALERSVLPKVQARIRKQTHGRYFSNRRRFYRDPTILLLCAAMFLLILAGAVFGVLDSLLP